ncbi:MAG: signal peptidase II [Firmicutes bacterium]|nr:signal peptidase II [Bacillota bacterium]
MPKIKYKFKKDKNIKEILDKPLDKNKVKFFSLFILIPMILTIIDQFTKILVNKYMIIGDEINVIPGFFNINYVINKGAALGIFENMTFFLVIVSLLMIIFIYFLAYNDFKSDHTIIPEMIIVGGAIGNLIDRIFLAGNVRDFLEVPFFAVMNFADWFVSIGIALLLIKYIYYYNRIEKNEKKNE